MELVNKIFFLLFVVLMVLAIVGIYLQHNFISLLKQTHHEKWEELGRPGLVMNNSVKNNIAIFNFLRKKEYLEISDHKLTKTSLFLWNFGRIYLVFLTTVICFFPVSLFTKAR